MLKYLMVQIIGLVTFYYTMVYMALLLTFYFALQNGINIHVCGSVQCSPIIQFNATHAPDLNNYLVFCFSLLVVMP